MAGGVPGGPDRFGPVLSAQAQAQPSLDRRSDGGGGPRRGEAVPPRGAAQLPKRRLGDLAGVEQQHVQDVEPDLARLGELGHQLLGGKAPSHCRNVRGADVAGVGVLAVAADPVAELDELVVGDGRDVGVAPPQGEARERPCEGASGNARLAVAELGHPVAVGGEQVEVEAEPGGDTGVEQAAAIAAHHPVDITAHAVDQAQVGDVGPALRRRARAPAGAPRPVGEIEADQQRLGEPGLQIRPAAHEPVVGLPARCCPRLPACEGVLHPGEVDLPGGVAASALRGQRQRAGGSHPGPPRART